MKTCFVLEGGALRGIYTSAILDYLYEKHLPIDCIIGVSAGALFGVNYFSDQPGRTLRYNLKYYNDKRYMSIRSLILTGNLIGKNFAYYKLCKTLDPFDEASFEKNNKDFYLVKTNMETGEPEYVKLTKPLEQMEELRATSAMPFFSRIIKIDGKKYLDGAIGDSIPVKKAFELGYDRVVVILTQPYDFKKKDMDEKHIKKAKRKYKKYPKFLNKLINRPKEYNKLLDNIKKLEKDKKIFVIRPSVSVEINPIKKTQDDLNRIYNIGKKDIETCYKDLVKYLK
jgi:predicted patatin/cPLA2 family phospholipase